MTKFDKDKFEWDGMYLQYVGPYEGQKTYDEVFIEGTYHESRKGMPIPLFIARFKHRGPITKAKFQRELMKSWTVEEYAEASQSAPPVTVLREKNPQWYNDIMEKAMKKLERV